VKVSRKGLPALERTLDDTRPLLARLERYLRVREEGGELPLVEAEVIECRLEIAQYPQLRPINP